MTCECPTDTLSGILFIDTVKSKIPSIFTLLLHIARTEIFPCMELLLAFQLCQN